MLYRSELKKLLWTQKGLLLLTVCLLCKLLCFSLFPEMKDTRIQISQKQYDKYLAQLEGENTPEKSQWILAESEACERIIGEKSTMEQKHWAGELTDEEWDSYAQQLDEAYIHQNSAKIFAEKATQFAAQPDTIPPAHYIYEYGWRSIFTLGKLPDLFLMFGLILLSSMSFSFEAQNGMLPVLLSAKNGRRKLLLVKLLALLTAAFAAVLVSGAMEFLIFTARGWCIHPEAPLYSVQTLKKCVLPLSLGKGWLLALGLRSVGALLFCVLVFSLSQWIKNAQQLVFLGLGLLLLPLLWNTPAMLFFPTGFLLPTQSLFWLGLYTHSPWFPLLTNAALTAALFLLSMRRYRRGL